MLRLLALILLLANGLYYAWGHELLRPYGLGPVQQNEPQRLAQQIGPERVRLLSAEEFKRVEEEVLQDQAPKECLQAGPLDAALVPDLRQMLEPLLPPGSWALEESAIAERWIVYMGKYASAELLAKKRAEVAALKLKPESLDNPALEPGFSLGGFEARADAQALLARLAARGLRSASVVQERAPGLVYVLRLSAITAAQKSKLSGLRSVLGSQTLQSCN